TVFPVRGRRVHQAIHLDTRCDGSAHGGCQASCLLFWKEAWLKPLGNNSSQDVFLLNKVSSERESAATSCGGCSEITVWDRAKVVPAEGGEPSYICQATQLPYATS